MFNNLTALGLGITTFAIVVGVGTVILTKFGGAVAGCPSGSTWSATTDTCCVDGAATCTGGNTTTPTGGWATTNYLTGQLGTSGLAGWAPAIIALAVGLLFLGAFMMKRGQSY